MDISNLAKKIRGVARRLTAGFLLFTWIIILLWLGSIAIEGASGFSNYIMSLFIPDRTAYRYLPGSSRSSPNAILKYYLDGFQNPPPIESMLDQFMINPTWRDIDIASKFPQKDEKPTQEDKDRWISQQYLALFMNIERKLNEISKQDSIDLETVKILIAIPASFKRNVSDVSIKEISLPIGAKIWIGEERKRKKDDDQMKELLQNLLMLIVLGAFGSLIFLIKEYIDQDETIPLSAYFFRPILGMFLALGMFVIVAMAQSVLSTASLLQIRKETLFILAFAGGLLTEQAYEVLYVRAKTAIEEFREQATREKAKAAAAGPPTSNNSG
jgi:hypothetical protein